MRIGLLSDSYEPYISGVTASLKMLANGLREMGHEVYIFTITYKDLTEEQKNDPYVIRFKGISVPMKGLNMFQRIPFVGRHVKEIKKYNLDLIHIHSTSSMGTLGLKVKKKLKIPAVFTAHTIYEQYVHFVSKLLPKLFPRTIKFFIKRLMNEYIENSDVTIVPSNKMKKLMLSYGIEKDYKVIPTGLNLDDFKKTNYTVNEITRLKTSLKLKEDDFICLYVGRISLEKNIIELLEGFKEIDNEQIKMVIVGGGPYFDKLQSYIKDHNLEKRIITTNLIPWGEIGLYYQIGDIFLNASQSETQGLTYIEALAASLPVVVKEDDVLVGVVEDGYNGLIFNNKDQLITNILKLYNDYELKEYMASNALNSIKKYSYLNYAKNAYQVYLQAIEINNK